MNIFCNPINIEYLHQFHKGPTPQDTVICREAADPSMICFRGRYYIFASMTLGVWVSNDLLHWQHHPLPQELPLYDYAPDVRVLGDYVYLSASKNDTPCHFYRTKDILNGPYERIPGTFPFWDPNLFADTDGRLYFYWGCSNASPIWGVELDPDTLEPLGEKTPLIWGNPFRIGYERLGENHSLPPCTASQAEDMFRRERIDAGENPTISEDMAPWVHASYGHMPYIEGAWLTKHGGRYYLQYACPGTEFNTYCDGVYESDRPLGPFTLAKNNPYSYHPGGFASGAGHGSTMQDLSGAWWHTATCRISVNHIFERRVGLWPAGFDRDGVLFCNQRYGDWPMNLDKLRQNPWAQPDWYLLSFHAAMTCSGSTPGHGACLAADESIQTWWQADFQTGWLQMDLGSLCSVHAVQINFADDSIPCPPDVPFAPDQSRYIDAGPHRTRWLLEGSADGQCFTILADRRQADTDLSHDLVVLQAGVQLRHLRLTVTHRPYGQPPAVSGLRVFGKEPGPAPAPAQFTAQRKDGCTMSVSFQAEHAVGCNILWGFAPDKLYHSRLVFGSTAAIEIGALVDGQDYFLQVDSFNRSGITPGMPQRL